MRMDGVRLQAAELFPVLLHLKSANSDPIIQYAVD